MRSSSPPWAQLLARHQRTRFKASWGLAETGAAGPAGNAYGDPAGHSCLAVDGPVRRERMLRTGSNDRQGNMLAFAMAALQLLDEAVDAAPVPVPRTELGMVVVPFGETGVATDGCVRFPLPPSA